MKWKAGVVTPSHTLPLVGTPPLELSILIRLLDPPVPRPEERA